MYDGMDMDQGTLITVLQNKLAQSVIREAQLESAVQQLLAQQNELMERVATNKAVVEVAEEG